MLAAKRRAARHGDITPKIGQPGGEEFPAVQAVPAHMQPRGRLQPAEAPEPEPPVMSEAEQQQRSAMIEALRRELGSTEVSRGPSEYNQTRRRALTRARSSAQIHMSALETRRSMLTQRLAMLEAGGHYDPILGF